LRRLETETPDAIFTDIRMPVMDGLELIREVRKRDSAIPFVILSGYRDFAYAQEALKSQAFDYLLKPVSPDDLREALRKLRSRLDAGKEARLREAVGSALLGEHRSNADKALFEGTRFMLLVARYGGSLAETAMPSVSDIEAHLAAGMGTETGTARTGGHEGKIFAFRGGGPAEKVAVVLLGHEDAECLEELEELACCALVQAAENSQPDRTANVAIGRPVDGLPGIASSLLSLRELLRRNTEYGSSKRIREDAEFGRYEEDRSLAVLTNERIEAMRTMIRLRQKSLFKAELSSLLEDMSRARLASGDFATLLKKGVRAFGEGSLPASGNLDIDGVVERMLEGQSSYEAIQDRLGAWLEDVFFEGVDGPSRNSPEGVVDALDEYLKANSHQDLDLKKLASGVGLTAPYLSKLFKLYRGMPLIEYVSFLKIEKAKQLIRSDPNLLAKEIGELLGFADPFYFSRLFKKIEGVSPSEYRKRVESGE